MITFSVLENPNVDREGSWYTYKRLRVGVTIKDPVYLSHYDHPKDSPSLLPGDPNFPLVHQKWNETSQKWVNAHGGKRIKNQVPETRRVDSRKGSRAIKANKRLKKNQVVQPFLYKRKPVYNSTWMLVPGAPPTNRQKRQLKKDTDEMGVIHIWTAASPPRQPDSIVVTTAADTPISAILAQFPEGNYGALAPCPTEVKC